MVDLLTHEIEHKNRTMLELRSKIEALEKQNEKKHNEAVTKYEGQIKEIKKKGEEKMNDNTTKMQELQTTYNLMDESDKKKF